jgi:hypothetical protein
MDDLAMPSVAIIVDRMSASFFMLVPLFVVDVQEFAISPIVACRSAAQMEKSAESPWGMVEIWIDAGKRSSDGTGIARAGTPKKFAQRRKLAPARPYGTNSVPTFVNSSLSRGASPGATGAARASTVDRSFRNSARARTRKASAQR